MIVILTDRELERFWNKVEESDSCWNWTASKYPDGYGAFNLRGKCNGAHRVSWWIHRGEIPEGLEVCHHCDNPKCVKPDHLYVATHAQNIRDIHIRGRANLVRGDKHWTKSQKERFTGENNHARQHPERMARGERNGNSKLCEEAIRTIRTLYALKHANSYQIGAAYGVHRSVVMDIVKRKTWRHVA